jgi:hypothetical protein
MSFDEPPAGPRRAGARPRKCERSLLPEQRTPFRDGTQRGRRGEGRSAKEQGNGCPAPWLLGAYTTVAIMTSSPRPIDRIAIRCERDITRRHIHHVDTARIGVGDLRAGG